ncbi:MAG: hypothetical protein ACOCWM_06135, partial [Cyclobacteriaceae bacterium]
MKFLSYLVILIIINSASVAQNYEWAFGFGGWVEDNVGSLITDEQKNIYFTGNIIGAPEILDYKFEEGFDGAAVIKMNSEGKVIWIKSIGYDLKVEAKDITLDSKNNIFVLGYYRGNLFRDDQLVIPWGEGTFLLKLNKDGQVDWFKDMGSFYGVKIKFDSQDNFYVAGMLSKEFVINDSTYYPRDSFMSDLLLIKYNGLGEAQWVKNPGGIGTDYLYDMDLNENTISMVGTMSSYLEIEDTKYYPPDNGHGFALNYSIDGEFKWVNTIRSDYVSYCKSVSINDLDETIIAGNLIDKSNQYFFMSKMDKTGTLLNQQKINVVGFYSGVLCDIASYGKDTYFAAAYHDTLKFDRFQSIASSGYKDFVLVKMNEVGFPQWISEGKGTGQEVVKVIEKNGDNIYLAGEYFSDTLYLQEHYIVNNSGNNDNDVFISRMTDNSVNQCPPVEDFNILHKSSFCAGDSILISVENPYTTYTKWYHNNISLAADNLKSVYIKEAGTYKVEVNHDTRCPVPPLIVKVEHAEAADWTTNIIINPLPLVDIITDTLACSGDTLLLSTIANDNYNYHWNIPAGIEHTSITNDQLEVFLKKSGKFFKFQVNVIDSKTGCEAIDSAIVEVKQSPMVQLVLSGNTIDVLSQFTSALHWFFEGEELVENRDKAQITIKQTGNYFVKAFN